MAVTTRLALGHPVPVLLAAAHGSARTRHLLRADPRVRLVRTPRHAVVLAVAGRVPAVDGAALLGVHDQLPHPRAVVTVGASGLPAELAVTRDATDDVVADVLAAGRDALSGTTDTPDLLPAQNPVAWQGIGPHGTGGEGMMGGVPYGRPMPMTADGRDGMALDRLPLVFGPWLLGLPAGCRIEAGLQGDVLETATVHLAGLADPPPAVPMKVAQLERLRARVLLGWVADLADLAGLESEAVRVSRVALTPSARGVRQVRRRLGRPWGLRLATDGVAGIEAEDLADRGLGWLARSRGIDEDARRDDPAYAGLDLPVPVDRGGDLTARWRTWLDEAATALRLAEQAGEERTTETPELPWGPLAVDEPERIQTRRALATDLATGSELGRALLGVAGLPGAADAESSLLAGVPA